MLSCRNLLVFCLLVVPAGAVAAVGAVAAEPVKPTTNRVKPKDGPLGMKFVPLPKGDFYMGGGGGKAGKKTEIKEDFEIAVYTVTQGQWGQLMGNNPSWFSREGIARDDVKDIKEEDLKQFPVTDVSWHDAKEFIKKLNENEKGKGYVYRLPTEAEWEYACRGGATTEEECSYDFYFEKPTNDLSSKQANFVGDKPAGKGEEGPFLARPTKVGSYAPNKLGLYDMHGNVWQWCEDRHDLGQVWRGGSWRNHGRFCSAAGRDGGSPSDAYHYLGFRLARVRVR
jgi:formylglycine-generating enzyme required for sulfatase activity